MISVIMPVYNSENYVSAAIESIIDQSFKDIELIIVDDGSSDLSYKICESYATLDSRIILIKSTHRGQSCARNLALEIASGDFIAFVDSDDVLGRETYAFTLSIFEQHPNTDIIQFPSYRNCGSPDEFHFKPTSKIITDQTDLFLNWITYRQISWVIWDKIYKKKLFDKVRFQPMYYEDNFLLVDIFELVKEFRIIEKGSYYYHKRINSITTSPFSKRKAEDTQRVNIRIYEAIKKLHSTNNIILNIQVKILISALVLNLNYHKEFNAFPNKEIKSSNLLFDCMRFEKKLFLLLYRFLGKRYFCQYNVFLSFLIFKKYNKYNSGSFITTLVPSHD
jgi:glycosyltransferase involved in cell wall biosynthesis